MPHQPREWSSYLPDGRRFHVTRVDDGWEVACEQRRASGPGLSAVLEEAAGPADSLDVALRQWIRQRAVQIEADRAH